MSYTSLLAQGAPEALVISILQVHAGRGGSQRNDITCAVESGSQSWCCGNEGTFQEPHAEMVLQVPRSWT